MCVSVIVFVLFWSIHFFLWLEYLYQNNWNPHFRAAESVYVRCVWRTPPKTEVWHFRIQIQPVTPLCSMVMLPPILIEPCITWKFGWKPKPRKIHLCGLFCINNSHSSVWDHTSPKTWLKSSLFPVIWTLHYCVNLLYLLVGLRSVVQKW